MVETFFMHVLNSYNLYLLYRGKNLKKNIKNKYLANNENELKLTKQG